MSRPPHPEVPESIFDEQDKTVEREYTISLQAVFPFELTTQEQSPVSPETAATFDDDLSAESVQITSLSFQFTGTYRDAYITAQQKCDSLNEPDTLGDSEWEFESGAIRLQ